VLPRSPAELLEPARAPEPPRRRRAAREKPSRLAPLLRFANGFFSFLFLALILFGAVALAARHVFDMPGPLEHPTVFVIPKGEGLPSIAGRLEREGVISDSRLFAAAVYYMQAQARLKAGEFEIRKNASMRAVLDALIDAHLSAGATISRAVNRGRHGHPTIFAASLLDELRRVDEASEGMKSILRRHADLIRDVEIDDPSVLLNLNTPEEYEAALKRG
jgi:hypothetical protein